MFDKVDHGILLHKLRALGITGNIGIWLFHFLTDRSHFVRLPGGISRYVKLFVRSSKLLRHYFCARESQLHKKVKLQERPISLFVNRSCSFMDQ